jgi:hypothetical protein
MFLRRRHNQRTLEAYHLSLESGRRTVLWPAVDVDDWKINRLQ